MCNCNYSSYNYGINKFGNTVEHLSMGKLRTVKKSRGHYAAKKETDLDEHSSIPISSLENIALHTKGFSGVKDKVCLIYRKHSRKPHGAFIVTF